MKCDPVISYTGIIMILYKDPVIKVNVMSAFFFSLSHLSPQMFYSLGFYLSSSRFPQFLTPQKKWSCGILQQVLFSLRSIAWRKFSELLGRCLFSSEEI